MPELLAIDSEPELLPSVKSAPDVLPELVQYRVVPLATKVVLTVKRTAEPSLTDDTFDDTAYVGTALLVSLIVTLDDVARIVPDVDPILTCRISVSEPSVNASLVSVLVTVPVLLVIVNEPEFRLSLKSALDDVPELVQYRVVPSAVLAVIVKRTAAPSFTEYVLATITGAIEVSLTETDVELATIVPDVLFTRRFRITDSVPSVTRSLASVLVIVAELLLIDIEPEFRLSLKSAAAVLPELVQYSDVPLAIDVVLTVKRTLAPSSTEDVLAVIVYVGATLVSLIVTVLEVATIVPVMLSVRISRISVSGPSVIASFVSVLVIVAEPFVIVNDPEFKESL